MKSATSNAGPLDDAGFAGDDAALETLRLRLVRLARRMRAADSDTRLGLAGLAARLDDIEDQLDGLDGELADSPPPAGRRSPDAGADDRFEDVRSRLDALLSRGGAGTGADAHAAETGAAGPDPVAAAITALRAEMTAEFASLRDTLGQSRAADEAAVLTRLDRLAERLPEPGRLDAVADGLTAMRRTLDDDGAATARLQSRLEEMARSIGASLATDRAAAAATSAGIAAALADIRGAVEDLADASSVPVAARAVMAEPTPVEQAIASALAETSPASPAPLEAPVPPREAPVPAPVPPTEPPAAPEPDWSGTAVLREVEASLGRVEAHLSAARAHATEAGVRLDAPSDARAEATAATAPLARPAAPGDGPTFADMRSEAAGFRPDIAALRELVAATAEPEGTERRAGFIAAARRASRREGEGAAPEVQSPVRAAPLILAAVAVAALAFGAARLPVWFGADRADATARHPAGVAELMPVPPPVLAAAPVRVPPPMVAPPTDARGALTLSAGRVPPDRFRPVPGGSLPVPEAGASGPANEPDDGPTEPFYIDPPVIAEEPPVGAADRAALLRTIQELLAEKGYDPGPPDGIDGPKTRDAIRAFQRTAGLAESGLPDGELVAMLGGVQN